MRRQRRTTDPWSVLSTMEWYLRLLQTLVLLPVLCCFRRTLLWCGTPIRFGFETTTARLPGAPDAFPRRHGVNGRHVSGDVFRRVSRTALAGSLLSASGAGA